MIIRRVEISKLVGMRYDVSFYQERFDYSSQIYPTYELGDILYINPSVTFSELRDNDVISYVPMEAIDERYGIISLAKNITVANTKGYTKFKEGDLLWAKITPCMQNGKSAIAQNLLKGVGCGSTEFFVLRPKSSNVLIKYIHFILRDYRVLKSAQNSFGGSAGQQRVSSSYLKTIRIPLPPIEIQQKLVDIYTAAQNAKLQKDKEAKELLESIDNIVTQHLGIKLPERSDFSETKYFTPISKLIGQRYDPYFHNPYFERAFAELAQSKYPLKKLGDISILITSGITPKAGGDAYTDSQNGIAFIRSGDIDINGNINFEELLYIKPEVHNKQMKSSKVYDNDIMIAIVGATIGQVGIYHSEKEANINQAIALVRLKDGYNPEYVKELIKSSIGQLNLDRLKRPVARANINLEEIASISIPIPERVETQAAIANEIQNIRIKAEAIVNEGFSILENAQKTIEKMILG